MHVHYGDVTHGHQHLRCNARCRSYRIVARGSRANRPDQLIFISRIAASRCRARVPEDPPLSLPSPSCSIISSSVVLIAIVINAHLYSRSYGKADDGRSARNEDEMPASRVPQHPDGCCILAFVRINVNVGASVPSTFGRTRRRKCGSPPVPLASSSRLCSARRVLFRTRRVLFRTRRAHSTCEPTHNNSRYTTFCVDVHFGEKNTINIGSLFSDIAAVRSGYDAIDQIKSGRDLIRRPN